MYSHKKVGQPGKITRYLLLRRAAPSEDREFHAYMLWYLKSVWRRSRTSDAKRALCCRLLSCTDKQWDSEPMKTGFVDTFRVCFHSLGYTHSFCVKKAHVLIAVTEWLIESPL